MPNTVAEAIAWSAANPTDRGWPVGSHAGTSWSQKCVSFIHRMGNFGASAASARLVYEHVKKVHGIHTVADLPLKEIPKGWMVYFTWTNDPNGDGHIGMSMGGGNFLSATAWYPGIYKRGTLSISAYCKSAGATYRGASPYFMDQKLEGVPSLSTAGSGGTVVKPPTAQEGEPIMLRVKSSESGKFFVIGEFSYDRDLTQAEASAYNSADHDTKFSVATNAEITLLLNACKARAARRDAAIVEALLAKLPTLTPAPAADPNPALVVRILRAVGAALTGTK